MNTANRKRLQALFVFEFAAVLASVAIAYATHWRIPVSPWVAAPIGLVLWACGFIYTMHLRSEWKEATERRRRPARRRGFPFVEARAAMHLGVAIGFRSWPTLIVAAACLAINLWLAISMRRRLRERLGDFASGRSGPPSW
jgi:hypothetical protein